MMEIEPIACMRNPEISSVARSDFQLPEALAAPAEYTRRHSDQYNITQTSVYNNYQLHQSNEFKVQSSDGYKIQNTKPYSLQNSNEFGVDNIKDYNYQKSTAFNVHDSAKLNEDFQSVAESILSEKYSGDNSSQKYTKNERNLDKMVVDTQVSDVQPGSPDTVSQKGDDFFQPTDMDIQSDIQMSESFAQAKQMIEAFAQASRMNNNCPSDLQMSFPSINFSSSQSHDLVNHKQISPHYTENTPDHEPRFADRTQEQADYSSSSSSSPSPKQLLDQDGAGSPSSGANSEDRKSKRKPTLEDIVRRMRETEQSYSEEEMSDEDEQINGDMETTDMQKENKHANDSTVNQDGNLCALNQDGNISVTRDNESHKIAYSPTEGQDAELNSNNNVQSPGAEMVPSQLKAEIDVPTTTIPSSNASGVIPDNPEAGMFSPPMNGWPPKPYNGMPIFPFPPHPTEHNLAAKLFPNMDNKFPSPPDAEKDYLKCQFCERTFRRQKNLENHIETAHQGKGLVKRKPDPSSGEMYFKCTHCPYTTKHQSNLYVHLRIHTGERPYICGACGVQYSQSHSLKSHIINKHDGIMSFYIKEKRNRSPRGLSYITTHVTPENIPLRMTHHAALLNFHLQQQQQQQHQIHQHLQQQIHPHQMPPLDSPIRPHLPSMESFKSPIEQLRSPGSSFKSNLSSPHMPSTNGHLSPNIHNSQLSHLYPYNQEGLVVAKPPGSSPATMPTHDDFGEAIDLSKKPTDQLSYDRSSSPITDPAMLTNCGSCKATYKLRLLRMNVIRMLSILVPNLNFEDKGISADSESVDELLQDVIESNLREDDPE